MIVRIMFKQVSDKRRGLLALLIASGGTYGFTSTKNFSIINTNMKKKYIWLSISTVFLKFPCCIFTCWNLFF